MCDIIQYVSFLVQQSDLLRWSWSRSWSSLLKWSFVSNDLDHLSDLDLWSRSLFMWSSWTLIKTPLVHKFKLSPSPSLIIMFSIMNAFGSIPMPLSANANVINGKLLFSPEPHFNDPYPMRHRNSFLKLGSAWKPSDTPPYWSSLQPQFFHMHRGNSHLIHPRCLLKCLCSKALRPYSWCLAYA